MSLVRTGTSIARSAEKTRQLLRGPRLLEIIGLTHKEGHFHSTATSTKSFSTLMAMTSSRFQAPI